MTLHISFVEPDLIHDVSRYMISPNASEFCVAIRHQLINHKGTLLSQDREAPGNWHVVALDERINGCLLSLYIVELLYLLDHQLHSPLESLL